MKKNSKLRSDEVDLMHLFKVIWDGKLKIAIITIIIFLIALGYSYTLPKSKTNLYSLVVKPYENSEFVKLLGIYKIVDKNKLNQINQMNGTFQISKFILRKFANELNDYNEFVETLKKIEKVKNNISRFPKENQEQELFKYANLFSIKEKDSQIVLNLKWENSKEALHILEGTIDLTINNLVASIYKELDELLEMEKKIVINKDKERLEFLKEQSLIAKELNIPDNDNSDQSNKLNNNSFGISYYLKGYKFIDKEIEIIINRNYQGINNIEKEINNFKKLDFNWINYNIYLTNVRSLGKKEFDVKISIIIGFIIGVFYVIISNLFKSHTVPRK